MRCGDKDFCEYCGRYIPDANATDSTYKRCSCGATALVKGSSAVWLPQTTVAKFHHEGDKVIAKFTTASWGKSKTGGNDTENYKH